MAEDLLAGTHALLMRAYRRATEGRSMDELVALDAWLVTLLLRLVSSLPEDLADEGFRCIEAAGRYADKYAPARAPWARG